MGQQPDSGGAGAAPPPESPSRREPARRTQFGREPQALLRSSNLGLEKLRFGMRLAKDLRHLRLKRYEHAARAIDEAGRLEQQSR